MKPLKLLSFALSLLAAPLAAQDMSSMRLLPGWQMENGNRMIGVEITLAPGWKTYWRAPGAGGIPPRFDFSGSRNLAASRVHWPTPEIFELSGTRSIGYRDRVIFPVELTPRQAGPMVVDLALFYGVCADVCIPAEADDRLRIAGADRGAETAIAGALAQAALGQREAGVAAVSCALDPAGEGFALTARLRFSGAAPRPEAVVFETGSEEIYIRPRATHREGKGLRIDAELHHWGDGPLVLDRSALRLTLLGGERAIDISGCPAG